MKRWKQVIAMGILLNIAQTTFAQTGFDALSKSLDRVIKNDSLPGISVVLVNANHIIYEHNSGYADVANHIKYTSQTIQNIGSVSKTFIAVALMKAVEAGYFTLETDINTLLPFKVVNPNCPGAVITVRELSNHTSGIVDNPDIFPGTYEFDEGFAPYDTAAYRLLKNLGYRKQVSDEPLGAFLKDYLSPGGRYYNAKNFGSGLPGSSSSYSNIASALAAYIIEVKSGMSYALFTEKYILKPLKMENSGWFLKDKPSAKYAKPYYNLTASFPFYQCITYPDGGLRTNTADLGKYLMALINGYNGDELLLRKSSYQAMFAPQFSKEHPPKGISLASRNKGIFWNLYNNGTIGHDGDDPGVSSFLFFNPATGIGGVFICNKYLADKSDIITLLFKAANEKQE